MLRVIALPVLFAMRGFAQEEAAEAVDYTRGFELLAELGLPGVAGSEWGKLELNQQGSLGMASTRSAQSAFSAFETSPTGNAWKLAAGEDSDRTPVVMAGGTVAMEVSLERKQGFLSRLLRGPQREPPDGPAGGTWKESGLASDVATICKALEDYRPDPDEAHYSFMGRYGVENGWGHLLVFASQLHGAGHAEEANRLAALVVAKAPTPKMAVDQAVSVVAEGEFEEVTDDFFESRDWTAYHDGLAGLAEKYPRGWDKAGAVRLLIPKVKARAAEEPAPDPSIEGETLTAEALAAIGTMGEVPEAESPGKMAARMGVDLAGVPAEFRHQVLRQMMEGGYRGYQSGDRGLWPLKGLPAEEAGQGAVTALCGMKMDGVLALAALATDETLLPRPAGSSRHRSSYYYGSGESPVEQARRIYGQMRRPVSRGELAQAALRPALPDGAGDLDDMPPDELQGYVVEWWREHRNEEPLDLARHYFEEGSEMQRREVAVWLAERGDDRSAALFETVVFEGYSVAGHLPAVEAYLRIRKEKAKAFFDKFAAAIRAEAEAAGGTGGSSDPYRRRFEYAMSEEGGVEGLLKKLEIHVAAIEPEEIIADVLAEEIEAGQGLEILDEMMSGKAEEHAILLVGGARRAEETAMRGALLGAVMRIEQQAAAGEPGAESAAANDWEEFFERTREDLGVLLADERELEGGSYGVKHVNELAALVCEGGCGADLTAMWEIWRKMEDAFPPVLLRQARARLAGDEIPPLPDPSRVGRERRRELAEKAAGLDPMEILAMLEAASWDERLAWVEMVGDWEGEMPESVSRLTRMVTRVKDDLPAGFAEWKTGQEVSAERIEKTVKRIEGDIDANAGAVVVLKPRPGGLGFELTETAPWRDYFSSQSLARMQERGLDKVVGIFWTSVEGRWQSGYRPKEETGDAPEEEGDKDITESIAKRIEDGGWSKFVAVFVVHNKDTAEKSLTEGMP